MIFTTIAFSMSTGSLSYEDQCKYAAQNQDRSEVLRLLPLVQHHSAIECNILHRLSPWTHLHPQYTYLLHMVSLYGWLNIIQLLVTVYHYSPLQRDEYGHLPLHYAALGGHLFIVQYFIGECGVSHASETKWPYNVLPLHWAALASFNDIADDSQFKLETVRYLIEQCHCDAMIKSYKGRTPLHYAAIGNDISVVKYLINDCRCDPLCVDNDGASPLQYAVERGNMSIVLCMINDCHCDPNTRGSDGRTLLHYAAEKGDFPTIVSLINDCHCDPTITDDQGCTPLHYASRFKHYSLVAYLGNDLDCHPNKYMYLPLHRAIAAKDLALVKHLIDGIHHDPMSVDGYGNTALHVACTKGCVPIIQYLLSIPTVDPLAKNSNDDTPLQLASNKGLFNTIGPLFAKFDQVRVSHSVGSFVNIIILGDPKAGKTTFGQVIIDRSSNFFKFGSVKHVKPSTAGIIPTKLHSTELGNVILHDLAGQPEYYSSHTAVLENLLQNSGAIFLLIINLTEEVTKQIHFWWSVVLNESRKVHNECHLIIIGSHVDEISEHEAKKKVSQLKGFVSELSITNGINVRGVYALNCRQRAGSRLKVVTTKLSKVCSLVRNKQQKEISLSCNFLYSILSQESIQNIFPLTIVKALCDHARQHRDIPLPEDIVPLLRDLHSSGLIVYLENKQDATNSWVIVSKEVLLDEVNGILFAPKYFKEHSGVASNTGIITTTALAALFPRYSQDMLVLFLEDMKLCQAVDSSQLCSTNLEATKISSTGIEEKLLFFPALIAEKRPQEIGGKFKIGWCLKCESDEFFLIRLLHVLLRHLAYQHALPNTATAPNPALDLQRRCSVWINGIHWHNNDGVETLVEQLEDNRCILVLMSCQAGAEVDMTKLHCELVGKIVALQGKYCPILHCTEYLIDPSELQYPFENPSALTCYNVDELLQCITEGKRAIVSVNDHKRRISIPELLPVETKRYLSFRTSFVGAKTGANLKVCYSLM